MISDTDQCRSFLKCYTILRDSGLTKLMTQVDALLDDPSYFLITKNEQSVILDEDRRPWRDEIEIHLIIFAPVVLPHFWEERV